MERVNYSMMEGEKYRLAALNATIKRRMDERTEEETVRALLSLSFSCKVSKKEKIGA